MKPIFILSTLLASAAFGQKLSSHVVMPKAGKTANVIVQYRTNEGEAFNAKVRSLGRSVKQAHPELGILSVEATAENLEELAADPNVEYVTPDRPVQGSIEFARKAANTQQLFTNGHKGGGVGVAIIDSGVNDQADLREGGSRIVYSESFVGGTAADGFGHGTHVAGIVAGNGAMSTGTAYSATIAGITPLVDIINLKVLNNAGAGADSGVIAAINRAIELRGRYKIKIINLSLGRPVFESYKRDPLCRAVEAAWKAGIVVVVSAGNNGRNNDFGTNGYGTISSPGNSPYVITVGAMKTQDTATRSDDEIATYSSKGPTLIDRIVKPDLVAPGNLIVSVMAASNLLANTYPTTRVKTSTYQTSVSSVGSNTLSNDYMVLSGTSMAAPMVSAAAAMLIQRDPSLKPDQVKSRLMKTASKSFKAASFFMDTASCQTFNAQYDIFTIGAGYLDVNAAMANTDKSIRSALSPYVIYNPTTKKVTLRFDTIAGTNVVWGENLVWGSNIVWGSNVVWGENVVRGENVVWGESTIGGFNVVWGESSPHGSSTFGANNVTPFGVLTTGESTSPAESLPGVNSVSSSCYGGTPSAI